MTRPPYRSVSPPTGTRPSDLTGTGTATNSARVTGRRRSPSASLGASELSSAQAQS
jgi:hypothetical protein